MISDPLDLLESELYVGTNHIYPTEDDAHFLCHHRNGDGTHDIRKQ
jgi:hypothetical protein